MTRGERGFVLPSWAVALSAAAVALALVGFGVSSDRQPDSEAATDSAGADTDAAQPEAGDVDEAGSDQGEPAGEADGQSDAADGPSGGSGAPADRRTAYVEVYNNSGISGLAAGTTATLQDSGWRVVATDNWYGEIPANTVYFPAGMREQADLLADDLGVARVAPSVAPMNFDRLTVILTTAP